MQLQAFLTRSSSPIGVTVSLAWSIVHHVLAPALLYGPNGAREVVGRYVCVSGRRSGGVYNGALPPKPVRKPPNRDKTAMVAAGLAGESLPWKNCR